jgi:uncharacterized protein YpuA (DUF1002 family)
MKKMKKFLAGALALTMMAAVSQPVLAADNNYCVALGADLKSDEKATVMELLGVTQEDLDNSSVTVTNEEEHKYLDDYLSSSVIGSRALSSVYVKEESDGYGIQVTTHNISYCTTGMYENALATAGMKNATVVVAGPFDISGTAALIGAVKAYSEISGEPIQAESLEAATEELVTTGEVAEDIGSSEAESLIGAVKDTIVGEGITDADEIDQVIDETAEKLNITLSDEDKEKINALMQKIAGLDLDVNQLKEQAKQLYDKLGDLNIDVSKEEVQGIIAKIIAWIKSLLS